MFDDLEHLMDKAMSIAPPGTLDHTKLEEELKRGLNANQTNPQLTRLAQADLPIESFVRLAAQQTKKEEPSTIFKGGYDHVSAEEFQASTGMSLYDPQSQHWASRIYMGPNTGLILKEETHKTFGRTIRGEQKAKTRMFRRRDPKGTESQYNGRLYSFLESDKYDPTLYQEVSQEQMNKWLYSSYNVGKIAESIVPFEVAESEPEQWGYDPDSETYFAYDDSRGNLTVGIGGKIDGDREQTVRGQLAIVAPEIDYDDLKSGKIGLTRPQVDQIFMMNVREHIKTAEGLGVKLKDGTRVYPFENLHEFPDYLKEAVVNGVFWSMLTPATSPKTMEFIAKGDWEGASKEFLIGDWQKELNLKGGSTWDRFVLISDALSKYGKELKTTKESAHIMKEGETLWGVSQELGITVEELQSMNPGINPRNIPIGYRLNVTKQKEITAETKEAGIAPEVVKITPEELEKKERVETATYISGYEGYIETPRTLPNEKHRTVGIGHLLDGSNRSRAAFKKALPKKNYNEYKNGIGTLTQEEAQKLFQEDLPDYIKQAKKLTGDKFDGYSNNLRKNLISATYRGSWGQSPTARKLLSEGKFEEAATEFLNNDEYRNAVKLNRAGIRPRMEAVAKAIRDEGTKKDVPIPRTLPTPYIPNLRPPM